MCGIAGLVSLAARSVAGPELDARLTEMSRKMERRGPDGAGFWVSEDGDVRFAFRRLAILDLRPVADQPMVSSRAPCVLVFNGEIYNWLDLRRELESSGVTFQTRCDAEVVLEALVAWGVDALPRLNGMFALAFWDGRSRSFLLARDRFGMKPLFYSESEGVFAFGSQLDQVSPKSGDADPAALASFLGYGYVPSPRTLCKGTFQLPPGEVLEIRDGRAGSPKPFVAAPFSSDSRRIWEEEALDGELDSVLTRAVSRHLVADVPVGIFLSSGTDSSLLASVAQEQAGALFACTAVDEIRQGDESIDVAGFAHRHRLSTHFVDIRATDAETWWRQMIAAFPDPCANVSALARMALSQRAKEDATVMLSGDGGDELFWGYPRMWRQPSLAWWCRRSPALQWMGRAVQRLSGGRVAVGARNLDYGSLSSYYSDLMRFNAKATLIAELCPDLGAVLDETDLYVGTDLVDDPWGALRRLETRHHLEYCLTVSDRTTMYHGIECRVPLLDLDMLSLAETVGADLCVRGGEGKRPLRRRLRAKSPAAARLPKRGFEVPPFERWMEGPLRPILSDLLSRPLWPDGLWSEDGRRRLLSWSTEPGHGVPHATRFTVAVLQAWRQEFSPAD